MRGGIRNDVVATYLGTVLFSGSVSRACGVVVNLLSQIFTSLHLSSIYPPFFSLRFFSRGATRSGWFVNAGSLASLFLFFFPSSSFPFSSSSSFLPLSLLFPPLSFLLFFFLFLFFFSVFFLYFDFPFLTGMRRGRTRRRG